METGGEVNKVYFRDMIISADYIINLYGSLLFEDESTKGLGQVFLFECVFSFH
jgi:hypothetical protein